ncbi:MAG: 16S rRNA (uracil(1498)-N(3))-methyltransferase [Vicinamibacterales bacterium]
MHRFFAPELDAGDESVALPRDEAEHLTRVLRLAAGDLVSVFDGRGHEFTARVTSAHRREVRVTILERVQPALESTVALTLAQAVLKADHMDDVVRDAVMLGVSAIQPLVTRRTETTVAALMRGARVDRWRRVALASVKQSGRAVLPDVRMPLTFETFLGEPRAACTLMLVEPRAEAPVGSMSVLRRLTPPADATILVGPEGGWTEAEWDAARERGVRLVTLGARTLRADAVPVAALSVLQFLWDAPSG